MLSQVSTTAEERVPSGLSELDRVLGGRLVAGSVVLIGGDPGNVMIFGESGGRIRAAFSR